MLLSQRFDYILISLVIIYYTKCKYEKKRKQQHTDILTNIIKRKKVIRN